ncbi:MAG TPA: hybrid sensor histidine kinase/response regulator [Rhodocyclaceae bacterium]
MRPLGIRGRITLLAVLPVLFTSIAIGGILVRERLKADQAQMVYVGGLLARQLASNAEFGLFSGNRDLLESIASSALTERAVVLVSIRDGRGDALVSLGDQTRVRRAVPLTGFAEGERWETDSVMIGRLVRRSASDVFDELFASSPVDESPPIGAVEVVLSLEPLRRDARGFMLWSATIAATVVAVVTVLSLRFGERLVGPLRRLGMAIERIGGGDFGARLPPEGGGDMRRLANGVNRMAERLGASRTELERRVEEATAELSEKKREAELANEAKSRFLAAASHDLRQPMHALTLFADQLNRQPLKGEAIVLAHRIQEASESLAGLLDSLLDISRLDAGAFVPNRRVFALAPLLSRLQAEYGESARAAGLRLRVRPSALSVESDPVMCERVLMNLISNAIRYTERGSILVAARLRSGMVRIEVRDSGTGIPEALQALVFSEFVQLANPERDQRKGLGLGLAIVARLCALLGHRLGLSSALGRGSCFWFELPPARALPTDAQEADLSSLAGRRVGIVEDDVAIVAGMRDLLASWGCSSVGAASLEELGANLAGADAKLDALICDHTGGEFGPQTAAEIATRLGYSVPLVIVSADSGLSGAARQAGIPLLTKPVRPARLRAALDSLLKAQA